MEDPKQQAHIVLVHGASHGAWCWYKLKPLLEESGHRVTALDLSASGINLRSLHELCSFADYTKPLLELMESIPQQEKVVLVGHSLGGINLGLAMEKYPQKISVAVFLAAFMPDTNHAPSYVMDKFFEQFPEEQWLDTVFLPIDNGIPQSQESPTTMMILGPKFVSSTLYQLCSPQDVELAKMLLRPSSLFLEDLSNKSPFTNEGFGSVKRVCILGSEDKAIPENYQRWQIDNIGVDEVKEIKNADHMPMLSAPQQLCQCLLDIAKKYY